LLQQLYKIPVSDKVPDTPRGQLVHLESRGDVTLPGEGVDMYFIPALLAGDGHAQHVALQATIGKILEEDECKLHRNTVNVAQLE